MIINQILQSITNILIELGKEYLSLLVSKRSHINNQIIYYILYFSNLYNYLFKIFTSSLISVYKQIFLYC